jgi:hypothetical protein
MARGTTQARMGPASRLNLRPIRYQSNVSKHGITNSSRPLPKSDTEMGCEVSSAWGLVAKIEQQAEANGFQALAMEICPVLGSRLGGPGLVSRYPLARARAYFSLMVISPVTDISDFSRLTLGLAFTKAKRSAGLQWATGRACERTIPCGLKVGPLQLSLHS